MQNHAAANKIHWIHWKNCNKNEHYNVVQKQNKTLNLSKVPKNCVNNDKFKRIWIGEWFGQYKLCIQTSVKFVIYFLCCSNKLTRLLKRQYY